MAVTLMSRLTRKNFNPADASEENISAHYWWSALFQLNRGFYTLTQFKDHFNMDAAQKTEFDTIFGDTYAALSTPRKREFVDFNHAVLMIAEEKKDSNYQDETWLANHIQAFS